MASKKGSKKEGGLDPDKHAKWTPRRRCHSYEDLKVTEIRWIKVLMANPTATGWANFGIGLFRVLTFGASATVDKDFSHECIEILYKCKVCGESGRFTAEILGEDANSFRCGFYENEICEHKSKQPSCSMTVAYIYERYDEMDSSYSFIGNNCSHWSGRLWDKI